MPTLEGERVQLIVGSSVIRKHLVNKLYNYL